MAILQRDEMLRQADNGAGGGEMPPTDARGNGAQPGGEMPSDTEQPAPSFDAWYTTLDAPQRQLLDGHLQGLRSSLATERQQRADLARQVKDFAVKAEKGSDLEKQLNALQASLQTAERRAAFAEDAARPEIGCLSMRAAYALAVADDLFDRQGRPDWAAIRQAAPELFRRVGAGSADGGAGTTGGQPKVSMNDIIRRAAGRG